ncbi:hypothetical protein [Streptomyces sp. 7N604]|uniref:hypothetical protein n=1 Tax=Streptomyces sp. 7N604 TaxID=3457415 RepID=UPI003FD3E3A4
MSGTSRSALDALPGSGQLTGAKGKAITSAWTGVLRWRELSRMRRDVPIAWQATGHVSPAIPKPTDVVEKLGMW